MGGVLSRTLLSLRGKVMLIVATGMAAVLAVLAVFVYEMEHRLIERNLARSYSETAASFAALVSHSIRDQNLRMLQAMVELKASEQNIRYIVVRDGRGSIVVRGGSWRDGIAREHPPSEQVLEVRSASGGEGESPHVLDARHHLLHVEAEIPDVDPPHPWLVQLGVDTSEARSEVVANTERIVLLSGAVLLVSLATMLFIDRRLRKILRDLIDVTRRMASGDRSLRVDIRTGDELQVLGESFNAMSAALREKEAEIQSHADDLEVRVRERTRALLAEKQKLSVILEAIRAGLVLYEPGPTPVWANHIARSWLSGRTALAPAMRRELFQGRGGVEVVADQALAGQSALETEKVVADEAGEMHSFQILATPIHTEPGGAVQALLLLLDVSEKRRLERELQHASKMAAIGELAGGVAHEVNTPIGVVIAKTEFLLERLEEHALPKDVDDLRKILRNAQRIAAIARGFLSFSRKAAARREDIAINPLVEETVQALTDGHALPGLRVETSLARDLPLVLANADEIEEILSNLITNALDAMAGSPARALLHVSTALDGECVTIRVRDTGPGVPPALKERIFEPFFSTKGVGRGTGLGLSISLGIVKAHGGEIVVENTGEDGSTFAVRLPLATEVIGGHVSS